MNSPAAVAELGARLSALGWVSELLVGGSLATGDYRPGVSDLDLLAVTAGSVDDARQAVLTTLHRELNAGVAAGLDLGCCYVEQERLADRIARHPTWTHGRLVHRGLSGVARAELVGFGYALFGRSPQAVFPSMSREDLLVAAREELTGYWTWAARRPWIWLDPVIADLGLTSMARGRHTLATGELLTKTAAIEHAAAPPWLKRQLRARRDGSAVRSPRLRTAVIAWRDAVRTTRDAGRN